jgi:hypothetical protein
MDYTFNKETAVWLERMQQQFGDPAEHPAPAADPVSSPPVCRLALRDVTVSVSRTSLTAHVLLEIGDCSYSGEWRERTAQSPAHAVASAAVSALNMYLEAAQSGSGARLELLWVGAERLSTGDVVQYAIVAWNVTGMEQRLIGSVLLERWGINASAAAVLDAVNRKMSLLG